MEARSRLSLVEFPNVSFFQPPVAMYSYIDTLPFYHADLDTIAATKLLEECLVNASEKRLVYLLHPSHQFQNTIILNCIDPGGISRSVPIKINSKGIATYLDYEKNVKHYILRELIMMLLYAVLKPYLPEGISPAMVEEMVASNSVQLSKRTQTTLAAYLHREDNLLQRDDNFDYQKILSEYCFSYAEPSVYKEQLKSNGTEGASNFLFYADQENLLGLSDSCLHVLIYSKDQDEFRDVDVYFVDGKWQAEDLEFASFEEIIKDLGEENLKKPLFSTQSFRRPQIMDRPHSFATDTGFGRF